MGQRASIREKCLTWMYVRNQIGVTQNLGVQSDMLSPTIPPDLREEDEGRTYISTIRRNNENYPFQNGAPPGRSDRDWPAQMGRMTAGVSDLVNIDEISNNTAYRDYLFNGLDFDEIYFVEDEDLFQ